MSATSEIEVVPQVWPPPRSRLTISARSSSVADAIAVDEREPITPRIEDRLARRRQGPGRGPEPAQKVFGTSEFVLTAVGRRRSLPKRPGPVGCDLARAGQVAGVAAVHDEMQAIGQPMLGERDSVPALQHRSSWLGDNEPEGVEGGEFVLARGLASGRQQGQLAARPADLGRGWPAGAVEHAGHPAAGRRHGEPRAAGLQVAAAEQVRLAWPVRGRRLPGPVREFVPDAGEEHGLASLDAEYRGAHAPHLTRCSCTPWSRPGGVRIAT